MKWFKAYEDVLKIRYTHLYGEQDCELFVRKEKQRLFIKSLVLVLLVSVIIGNDILVHKNEFSNVRMNRDGEIIGIERPGIGEESYSFSTKVKIISDSGEREKEYYITIEPAGMTEDEKKEDVIPQQTEAEVADAQLKSLISNLNKDKTEGMVILPDELENGDRLIWTAADDIDPALYLAAFAASVWMLYRSRFQRVKMEEKQARESIIRELPEFINRLVLLLNAGVVLNTAFMKIAEDNGSSKGKCSYFYRRMTAIAKLVDETNASFHQELFSFAKYSGVKELMRITNIMMDNISKGDDLANKLRRENELLWFARKQQAEENGRLAETKMTLPLMIMLMVLIMVSIAPALMEI